MLASVSCSHANYTVLPLLCGISHANYTVLPLLCGMQVDFGMQGGDPWKTIVQPSIDGRCLCGVFGHFCGHVFAREFSLFAQSCGVWRVTAPLTSTCHCMMAPSLRLQEHPDVGGQIDYAEAHCAHVIRRSCPGGRRAFCIVVFLHLLPLHESRLVVKALCGARRVLGNTATWRVIKCVSNTPRWRVAEAGVRRAVGMALAK